MSTPTPPRTSPASPISGSRRTCCRRSTSRWLEEADDADQAKAIPELLGGHDVIGQAQTGSGKTAAFGLPMLDYIDPENEETQAFVLTPAPRPSASR